MRKILFLLVLCATGLLSKTSFAQVNVRFNIESQPIWGPAGYNYVEYYYLPEIETYYYVPTRKYVYFENNRWITRSYLPRRYSNYNMYNAHKVVINERSPSHRRAHIIGSNPFAIVKSRNITEANRIQIR